MEIFAELNRLWASLAAPRKPLPLLPPEVKSRVVDLFDGTPKEYLNLMHADHAWRTAALDSVVLCNYLKRQQRTAPVEDSQAQHRALGNLLVAPRNLRLGRFRVEQIDDAAFEDARVLAIKPPAQSATLPLGTLCAGYSPNGQCAAVLHHVGLNMTLTVSSLAGARRVRTSISSVPLLSPIEALAIADDGNTVLLHGGQQDLLYRSADAGRPQPFLRTTLFDTRRQSPRTFVRGGEIATAQLAPSGRWCIIDLGTSHGLQLWNLTNSKPKMVSLQHPELVPIKSTLFFSPDETRVYYKTLRNEAFYIDFGL